MSSRSRKKPSKKQEHNQRMETTEIIGNSILPITFDDILGKFSIELYLQRKQFIGTDMDLDILSYRARNDRKHNATESDERNRCPIKRHILENKEYYRDQDSNLRKSSNDQRSAQLIHSSEYLQRKLLDSRIHETSGKNHTKRQSSDKIRIRSVRRKQIRYYNGDNIHYRHDDQSRTHEFSVFGFQFLMFRIFILILDSS